NAPVCELRFKLSFCWLENSRQLGRRSANTGFTRRGGSPKQDQGLRRVTKILRTPLRTRACIGRASKRAGQDCKVSRTRRVTTPSAVGRCGHKPPTACQFTVQTIPNIVMTNFRLDARPGEGPRVSAT